MPKKTKNLNDVLLQNKLKNIEMMATSRRIAALISEYDRVNDTLLNDLIESNSDINHSVLRANYNQAVMKAKQCLDLGNRLAVEVDKLKKLETGYLDTDFALAP